MKHFRVDVKKDRWAVDRYLYDVVKLIITELRTAETSRTDTEREKKPVCYKLQSLITVLIIALRQHLEI